MQCTQCFTSYIQSPSLGPHAGEGSSGWDGKTPELVWDGDQVTVYDGGVCSLYSGDTPSTLHPSLSGYSLSHLTILQHHPINRLGAMENLVVIKGILQLSVLACYCKMYLELQILDIYNLWIFQKAIAILLIRSC